MNNFFNNDKNIRINRFISAEFLPAIEKFKIARELLKKWSIDTDPMIYRLCSHTGPIPGMDFSMVKALGFIPHMHFSIARSICLISF